MRAPEHIVEIFLHQGDVYFGDRDTRIRTVLGSCVAITLWHPDLLIGGMCHYMLPSRRRTATESLSGKYADEALALMLSEIKRSGTHPGDYKVKLFGGGNMFPTNTRLREQHVGLKNAEAGSELLARHGLKVQAEHLGGQGHRNLIFDIWSGHVWMKHQAPVHSRCNICEMRELCLHT